MIFKTFKTGYELYPSTDLSLDDIINIISTDENVKKSQEKIRSTIDELAQKALKPQILKTVSFSCNLKERHAKTPLKEKFLEHTGYLLLDLDDLDPQIIESLKESIGEFKYTAAVWITVRGGGLAILVKCPSLRGFNVDHIEHEHKTAIEQLINLYEKEFNIKLDYLIDLCRLRFLSYDPFIIINDEALDFPYQQKPKAKPVKKGSIKLNGQYENITDREKKEICDLARYCIKNKIDLTDTYDSWYKIGYIIAGVFGTEGAVLFQAFSQFHPNYTPEETFKKYEHFVRTTDEKRGLTKKTLFFIADQKGINLVKLGLSKVKEPSIADKIDSIDIESFKSATSDEILKSSKTFPSHIYNLIPDQLKYYLSSYSGREKDIMLIHTLGILSGFFTNVRVRYGKDERPALYTYIITSSGVGKGLPDRSRKLIEPYDDLRRELYLEELKEWKIDKAKAKAEKDYTFVEEAPRPRKLWSSGNVTGAKLLRDLTDNENICIAAPEADAIANKMKGPHGADLSTFWRMCYHQESPSNETVTDGDIIAKDPFLSISLLSTANQLPRVIPNLTDGLFSRFSMYGYYDKFEYENPNLKEHNFNYLDKIDTFSKEIGILENQFKSITVVFSEDQNNQLTQIGKTVQKKVAVLGLNSNSISLITRGVVQHVRIAAILTNLRRLEEGDMSQGEVSCSTYDFEIALDIFQVLLDMNLKFFASLSDLSKSQTNEIADEDKESTKSINAFDSLPKAFKTSDAIKSFEILNVKKSTAEKTLKHWLETGLIEKDNRFSRGRYVKSD